ncbi:hypothetical protein NSTC731_00101 [Nostoc sp. DSM 114167]|jgi:predicted aspartyl protease
MASGESTQYHLDANLADNYNVAVNVYLVTLFWNSIEREVVVLGMDRRSLIGRALLEDSHLSIDFCDEYLIVLSKT